MSKEMSLESSYQSNEDLERALVVDRLSQEILNDPKKEQVYRDFMWQQIGDPDPSLVGAKKEPYPMEVWHNELHVYSEYIGGFYGDNGDLVSLRSVVPREGGDERAKDYYVAVFNLSSGKSRRPIVHDISKTVGSRRVQLIDEASYDNSPPSNRAGVHLPRYDQWRLIEDTSGVTLIYGRQRPVEKLYPIEELAEAVNSGLIERDGQLEVVHRGVGAVALKSIVQELHE